MSTRRTFGLALVVVGTTIVVPLSRRAHAEAPAADLVVRGRILRASHRPLPQVSGEINLDSLWTYEVTIVSVIHGIEGRRQIIVKGISDPQIRDDKDFIFDLIRESDGTYQLEKLGLAR